MKVNGIQIGEQTIQATREHFAQIHRDCISKAKHGEFRVNDLSRYIRFHTKMIENSLSGNSDQTLTFLQRAVWIQTGSCPSLLA